ncbi:transposase, partial [Ralstonia solanacearum species complex bacterium RW470]|uniref:transposase n=1 Tax=Ralstonia solanacearum species complex bacterium RW470 TaxID=3119580 RepID=UPI002FC2CFAF
DFAASLGLVPRQYSTGGRANLLGLSKRGDKNIRRLLVQCARAGFHDYRARFKRGEELNHLLAIHLLAKHGLAAPILAVKV